MDKLEQTSSAPIESYEPPDWLIDLLRISRGSTFFDEQTEDSISPELRSRYRAAAHIALNITKLRKERARIGFVPLSMADYIHGLVKVASVSLSQLLSWLGIDDLSRPNAKSAKGFARLAQEIGISLKEVLIHIRISFAEQIDSAPMPLLVARQRSTGTIRSQLEECDAVLSQIEAEYDLESLKELRRTEFEVRAAYKE